MNDERIRACPEGRLCMIGKSLVAKIIIVLTIWSCLWIPVSNFFPDSHIFPTAVLAPLIGFNGVLKTRNWQWPILQEITLPWLAYWTVLLSALYLTAKIHDRNNKPGD